MDKVARAVFHTIPRTLTAGLFLAGLALNFANIVGRYVFLSPIMSAEELLIYVMVWCVFVGAAIVTWEGKHLRMDVLSILLPEGVQRVLNAIAACGILVVSLIVLVEAVGLVRLTAAMAEKSVVAQVPMAIPYAALPVSFALIAGAVVWRARLALSGRLADETIRRRSL